MGIYMGVLSLEQASPFFQAITRARVAAYIIWQIIDEVNKYFCFLYTKILISLHSHRKLILNQKKILKKIF
jgi:hypothetical protein